MSQTADVADAIIEVDDALAAFKRELGHLVTKYPEWKDLEKAIESLQGVACGDGVHFDSLEEARSFRKSRR